MFKVYYSLVDYVWAEPMLHRTIGRLVQVLYQVYSCHTDQRDGS